MNEEKKTNMNHSKILLMNDIDKMNQRAIVGLLGMQIGQYIFDWATNPKRLRKANHRLAMEDLFERIKIWAERYIYFI